MEAWAMVSLETIKLLLNPRVSRLLDVAQASLPESQFVAFRKITLNEFGRNGLESDLQKEFNKNRKAIPDGSGSEWHGPE